MVVIRLRIGVRVQYPRGVGGAVLMRAAMVRGAMRVRHRGGG